VFQSENPESALLTYILTEDEQNQDDEKEKIRIHVVTSVFTGTRVYVNSPDSRDTFQGGGVVCSGA
jgi:hypothetical protein